MWVCRREEKGGSFLPSGSTSVLQRFDLCLWMVREWGGAVRSERKKEGRELKIEQKAGREEGRRGKKRR